MGSLKDPKSRIILQLGKHLCECTRKDKSKFNSRMSTTVDQDEIETFVVISCSECSSTRRISLSFILIEVINPHRSEEIKDQKPSTALGKIKHEEQPEDPQPSKEPGTEDLPNFNEWDEERMRRFSRGEKL